MAGVPAPPARPGPSPSPSRPCGHCAWPARRWTKTCTKSGASGTRKPASCCRTVPMPCTRCTRRWSRTSRWVELRGRGARTPAPAPQPHQGAGSLLRPSPHPPPAAGSHSHRGQAPGRCPRHHQVSQAGEHQSVGSHRGQARWVPGRPPPTWGEGRLGESSPLPGHHRRPIPLFFFKIYV